MSPDGDGVSAQRPVILGRVSPARNIKAPSGGGGRVNFLSTEERVARLDARFNELSDALGAEVQLAESIQAADPQLVLVFEARDEQVDLVRVAQALNLEVLVESEARTNPDDEFELKSKRPRSPLVSSCLHAVCVNQTALDRLLSLWRAWARERKLGRGYAPLGELFLHLKDVRPWGPQDRLKMVNWSEHFAGQLPGTFISIEIELWYRGSAATRLTAQENVTALVEGAGGSVTTGEIIEQIGYHGLKCLVPIEICEDLAQGRFDGVQVAKSANVMYLRITGQVGVPRGVDTDEDATTDAALPTQPPVVCLLDGVPAANHPLLADRVSVLDPDDLTSGYTVDERRHGTFMSSAVVWGDRSNNEEPCTRAVLVRPILVPSNETLQRHEELPPAALVPDLMWRAFRDLFEPRSDGTPPAAPQVTIVNLSVGDPSAPFDTIVSSWARMIDWLSYQYGVLVVVSAGNHPRLTISPLNSTALAAQAGDDRRRSVLDALDRQQNQRRLLPPAESINAITVGAIHDDHSGSPDLGYNVDPMDGLISISPVSATGSGYRRSIKPDLAAPGGRVVFGPTTPASESLVFRTVSPLGPGIKVASPSAGRETYTAGTSAAAALVTRHAARLHDLIDSVGGGTTVTRRQRAAAMKALLIHGTGELDELAGITVPSTQGVGNGILVRDFSSGCARNEAVLLFFGRINAAQEQELVIPLPNGLNVREAKRIDATLSWLSPINWRHRQYRRAALSFVKPFGSIPDLGKAAGLSSDAAKGGATTVQHQSWTTNSAFGEGQGSEVKLRVKCFEQAGGLEGASIDYAAVVSLWVAPAINVDVYTQVRSQIQERVTVQPT